MHAGLERPKKLDAPNDDAVGGMVRHDLDISNEVAGPTRRATVICRRRYPADSLVIRNTTQGVFVGYLVRHLDGGLLLRQVSNENVGEDLEALGAGIFARLAVLAVPKRALIFLAVLVHEVVCEL